MGLIAGHEKAAPEGAAIWRSDDELQEPGLLFGLVAVLALDL